MAHDRVWFGNFESATRVNCEGHGIGLAATENAVTFGLDQIPNTAALEQDPANRIEPLVRVLEVCLFHVKQGKRVVFLDGENGCGKAAILACAYLCLWGYAWDESWAQVLKVNPQARPRTEDFDRIRRVVREHFAPIK